MYACHHLSSRLVTLITLLLAVLSEKINAKIICPHDLLCLDGTTTGFWNATITAWFPERLGWVGFGIGESINNSELAIVWVHDGKVVASDRFGYRMFGKEMIVRHWPQDVKVIQAKRSWYGMMQITLHKRFRVDPDMDVLSWVWAISSKSPNSTDWDAKLPVYDSDKVGTFSWNLFEGQSVSEGLKTLMNDTVPGTDVARNGASDVERSRGKASNSTVDPGDVHGSERPDNGTVEENRGSTNVGAMNTPRVGIHEGSAGQTKHNNDARNNDAGLLTKSSPSELDRTKNAIITHGILMFLGWGVFMPVSMFIVRYLKSKLKWWFQIHIGVTVLGTILLELIAFVLIFTRIESKHFATPHRALGLIVIILSILQVGLGIISHSLRISAQGPMFASLHRYLGRFVIVLAVLTICLGIMETSMFMYVSRFVWLGVGFYFVVVLAVFGIAETTKDEFGLDGNGQVSPDDDSIENSREKATW